MKATASAADTISVHTAECAATGLAVGQVCSEYILDGFTQYSLHYEENGSGCSFHTFFVYF